MKPFLICSLLAVLVLPACASRQQATGPTLTEVARSDEQWTGVAVSREGRIFVNYPLWGTMNNSSVWEILPIGETRLYPDAFWNSWEPGLSPRQHFVCVQSVFIDDENFLWILDAANPGFQGVVAGGPKLVKVDLATDRVAQVISFEPAVAPADSYLNDVRVDTARDYAYITDSGGGALVVVDLAAGSSRRVLDHHSSGEAENIALVINGTEWRLPDGSRPRVHADGIALTRDGELVYYQALTGRTLYRIESRWLRDASLTSQQLGARVEYVDSTGPADGIIFGPDGNLYLAAIADNAIKRYLPQEQRIQPVVADPHLEWPDSFSWGPAGELYVTSSRINLGFGGHGPYRLFKINAPESVGARER